MKNYIKTAVFFMVTAAMCALLISVFHNLTTSIINKNLEEKETKLYQKLFTNYDANNSTVTTDFSDQEIQKKVVVKNADNQSLGFIVLLSSKNAYGVITILVGISNDDLLIGVEFLENGQTYPVLVADHVNNNYVNGISSEEVESIDVYCGATYGAQLVKDLVNKAFMAVKGAGSL